MLKIILSTETIQRGGKERQLFILANELVKIGYDVYIVSLEYSYPNYIDEYNFNIKKMFIVDYISFVGKYFSYKNIINIIKPDLVFSWDRHTALFSLFLHKSYGFQFVNGSIQHGIRLFKFSHLFRSAILWMSPYRLANSKAGLIANNLKPNNRNFILYNGIENKFVMKFKGAQLEIDRTALIPNYISNSKVFVSVANFVPYKDYSTVLDALSKVKVNYNFYYLILGEGPLRTQIELKIKELNLVPNVLLMGNVKNVAKFLRISDVFIHSSRGEGISNAILEAMFCGLPVIATNVGGTPELAFEKSVKLFEYKDIDRLHELLIRIDAIFSDFDPNDYAYQKHLGKFKVDEMVKNFESIIERIYNDAK